MELKCKFKQQNEIAERGSFRSRKVWVITEDNPDYPQTIEVEVAQDKIDLFNDYPVGHPMTLSINLRGREWTNDAGKTFVFNTLSCWKIVSDPATSNSRQSMTTDEIINEARVDQSKPTKKATPKSKQIFDEDDDLPF
jgi:hypothetical protein